MTSGDEYNGASHGGAGGRCANSEKLAGVAYGDGTFPGRLGYDINRTFFLF